MQPPQHPKNFLKIQMIRYKRNQILGKDWIKRPIVSGVRPRGAGHSRIMRELSNNLQNEAILYYEKNVWANRMPDYWDVLHLDLKRCPATT